MPRVRTADQGALRHLGGPDRARTQGTPPRARQLTSLDKIITRIRARGAGEVTSLVFERIRETVSSEDELIFFVVDPATVVPIEHDDFAFAEATREDATRFANDVGTDSERTFSGRVSDPATSCYLAVQDNRIVHSSWVTTTAAWTREIRSFVMPQSGTAYVYESYTAPEARGKGAYPFMLSNLCRDLAQRGIGQLWVAVQTTNPASQRAVTKVGFVEAARVAYRRRLGRLTVGPLPATSGAPRIGTKHP